MFWWVPSCLRVLFGARLVCPSLGLFFSFLFGVVVVLGAFVSPGALLPFPLFLCFSCTPCYRVAYNKVCHFRKKKRRKKNSTPFI
jgi:hypothetical protein